jgi:hypothetical protein
VRMVKRPRGADRRQRGGQRAARFACCSQGLSNPNPCSGRATTRYTRSTTAVTRARYVRRGGRSLSEDGEATPRG